MVNHMDIRHRSELPTLWTAVVVMGMLLGMAVELAEHAVMGRSVAGSDGVVGESDDAGDEQAVPSEAQHITDARKRIQAVRDSMPVYVQPDVSGLLYAETFHDDVLSAKTWVLPSASEDSSGNWIWTDRVFEGILGDKCIGIASQNQQHSVYTPLPNPISPAVEKNFIIQFEVKLENPNPCAGAYIKLIQIPQTEPTAFTELTNYSLIFGPDWCEGNSIVKLSIGVENPETKEWSHHDLENPPKYPYDAFSHLVRLWVKPDDTFEIRIDDKTFPGNLADQMTPSLIPPKFVNDPNDKAPADWATEKEILDMSAQKPSDWDDELLISDLNAQKPQGWLDDVSPYMHDPTSSKPAEWDEYSHGIWSPPLVPNPHCMTAPGCGPWQPPKIKNPNYKGTWKRPNIPNPEYKGEYIPRQIPNEYYFDLSSLHKILPFNAVGFDVWSSNRSILFDNIVISENLADVNRFTQKTWELRAEGERKLLDEVTKERLQYKNFYEFLEDVWMANRTEVCLAILGLLIVLLVAFFLLKKFCFDKMKRKPAAEKSQENGECLSDVSKKENVDKCQTQKEEGELLHQMDSPSPRTSGSDADLRRRRETDRLTE